MSLAVSLYQFEKDTTSKAQIGLLDFLHRIKDGYYQDPVLAMRTEKDPAKKKARKINLPNATISGTFSYRNATNIISHSGYIAVDIDHCDDKTHEMKAILSKDPLFYSIFVSCSGSGLCLIVKIQPEHHRASYVQISDYIKENYNFEVSADTKCKNLSRIRFVSYDPDLYLNENSTLFIAKEKKKKEKPTRDYLIVPSDLEAVIKEMQERKLNITSDYEDWLRVGFALAASFDEAGRDYYHAICSIDDRYDYDQCDEKYTDAINSHNDTVNANWLYDKLSREYNITAYSERTEQILRAAQAAFEFKIVDGVEGIKELLRTKHGYSDEDITASEEIIEQAIAKRIPIGGDSLTNDVEAFLHQRFDIKRNTLIQTIEVDGKKLDIITLNTMFRDASIVYPGATISLIRSLINTRYIPEYNPLDDLIDKYLTNPPKQPRGHIDAMIATIKTPTPHAAHFIRKWMVAMIPSAKGEHSVLMLILCGMLNTGKTEWFRRYLPPVLAQYRADSKLDDGKDSDILMSKKLLILDDEMGGKSKQEQRKLKNMTSKQEMSIRKPYDSEESELNRISMLAGTSNVFSLIDDPTGNRRQIPVEVLSINHEVYNAIDKELVLFECYLEWKEGYNTKLTNADIDLLKETTKDFIVTNFTDEVFFKYLCQPGQGPGDREIMTLSEIIIYLGECCRLPGKIDKVRIELILQTEEWPKDRTSTKRGYAVIKRSDFNEQPIEDLI